jgi:hypothetical protein
MFVKNVIMKTFYSLSAISFLLVVFQFQSFAQLEVNSNVTPEEMVGFFIGPGINYSNVIYTGNENARGLFSNGNTTNLGVDHGIALTSGFLAYVPGPNNSSSLGMNNGNPGDILLSELAGISTYDACVLEFDFIPASDTARCEFVFGSEEYPEFAGSSFNDIFGFFVTGPNPAGGGYEVYNIALVPGTELPVSINNINDFSYSEYYVDNTSGESIQYDGFTTVLTAKVAVVPGETYHFKLAIADAGDGIFDSGVMLEGQSFKSQGTADFLSFAFLADLNPGLSQDLWGNIEDDAITIEVPAGTDVTGLIASFETNGGVVVGVEGIPQQSGITPNDFTEPVNYHLDGYNDTDWQVKVNMTVGFGDNSAKNATIISGSAGKFEIRNIENTDITVYSITGSVIKNILSSQLGNSIVIDNLKPGIYFVGLEKDGYKQTRKVIVN